MDVRKSAAAFLVCFSLGVSIGGRHASKSLAFPEKGGECTIAESAATHRVLYSALQRTRDPDSWIHSATVRLEVLGPDGLRNGSGTIVEVDATGLATVVTCGHIFKKLSGEVPVQVTLFDGRDEIKLSGTALSFDPEVDVGVVAVPGVSGVEPIPLANADREVRKGSHVVAAGCDHGGTPVLQRTHITEIGRFYGFTNYIVAAKPPGGRSGGGLITQDHELIAICQGVDTVENDGVYVGLASIHAEIAKVRNGQPNASFASLGQRNAPPRRRCPPTAAVTGGQREQRTGVDVVCVVRTAGPDGKDEVLELKDVSQTFLAALRREGSSK